MFFQMVNLLRHLLTLLYAVLSYSGDTNESSYFVVTSGCPADHVSGFKSGGLKKMLSECQSW